MDYFLTQFLAYVDVHRQMITLFSFSQQISDKSSEITEDDIRTYFEMPQEFIHEYPVLIEKVYYIEDIL